MGDAAFIGIDGGGTGCRLLLVKDDQRFETDGGPCNVSTDLAGALRELSAGLDRLAAQAGIDRGTLRSFPTCLGLAGVVAGTSRHDISDALRLTKAQVVDDRTIALSGALGESDGALVGLGTGSFFAMQRGGTVTLAGGWGLRLGDEASGAWLGREMLTQCLATVDGLAPESPFSDQLLELFDGPAGIVAFSLKATPREYAALAPEIVEAADKGDRNASEIMRRGRAHVVTTLEAMGWSEGLPVCLTGGLAEVYARSLPEPLRSAIVPAKDSALNGAVALARSLYAEPEAIPKG